jgi:protein-S-isoprenylcysteine O-methyltransferase Ste14
VSTGSALVTPGARAFAWAGAVLFFGSLVTFLVAYETRFGEPAPSGPLGPAIAWDLLLFSVFALHHSVFARLGVRRWVARAVPPGLERSCYVWAASLLLIILVVAWQPVRGTLWSLSGPAGWVVQSLQLAGAALSIGSAASIDIWDLSGVTMRHLPADSSGHAAPSESRAQFRTTGPYGWVRHPIYLGWLLLVFSVATMTMTRLVFALASLVYIVAAIPFEERTLRRTSGDAYDAYSNQVRWKLLPGVF